MLPGARDRVRRLFLAEIRVQRNIKDIKVLQPLIPVLN
ncbi:MAG: hypothetical protein OP8BY_0610 [Candidatus Saccharicenans subterraneus]|uniref:Uncharacterized protein n=1 Tax=Candidatus Saccharicenans subterraneus TaxID=2508984 RepID=A0A3E2BKK2_9BACT|nr:MAG: hypothetical protein OP8BY_0610 [Candidatus Saccharicenans subterraneum]